MLCVGRGAGGEEGAGARLVGAKRVAAAAQHRALQRRNAGDVHQQPVHESRCRQRQPAQRVAAGRVDREQRVGEPAEPFEEIVGMTRPAPQPDIADLAAIGRIAAEAAHLAVGQTLAGDWPRSARRCRRNPSPAVRGRGCARRPAWTAPARLPRRPGSAGTRTCGAGIARPIPGGSRRSGHLRGRSPGALGDMQAKPQRPGECQARRPPGRARRARAPRAATPPTPGRERPEHIDPAGIAQTHLGPPRGGHSQHKADADGEEQQGHCRNTGGGPLQMHGQA